MRERIFKTIEEMEKFYYGDLNVDAIRKADASIISSTTGYWNKIYGAKVWSQINYEINAFAAIPKEPWVKTGWRLKTAAGHTFPSGGLAEGTTSNYTEIPETFTPTWGLISAAPKTVGHSDGMTQIAALLEGVDDTIPMSEIRQGLGLNHARAISAYLVQDVDTPASTGFESLDRVASSSAETAITSSAGDPDIYGLNRSGATTWDAQVSASGSAATHLRDLTITLIDGVWASITKAGGRPKVIFSGYNTERVWSSLLEANRSFNMMQIGIFVPRYNGAAGVTPGVEAGFNVATYHGVPIIPCQDYDSSRASVRTNEVSPIMFADMDYIRFAVLSPTKWMESNLDGDMLTGDRLAKEMYAQTVGELRCYNFVAQGKCTDIK